MPRKLRELPKILELGPHRIVYYSSSRTFEAQCGHAGHGGRCTWSAKRGAESDVEGALTGSLVGRLLAWLELADGASSKEQHKDKEILGWVQSDAALMMAARDRAKLLLGGAEFLRNESD